VILVDTSALLDYLEGRSTQAARYLEQVVDRDEPFALTPLVVQEVLQGARDEGQWRVLTAYLGSQRMLLPGDPMAAHVEAARIFFDARRRGVTIRSATDCLVAQLAIEHEVPLLHNDRDYKAIAKVRPLSLLP
jgi:predicted nucleic acid-binding protein